jgi:hypothetical protein
MKSIVLLTNIKVVLDKYYMMMKRKISYPDLYGLKYHYELLILKRMISDNWIEFSSQLSEFIKIYTKYQYRASLIRSVLVVLANPSRDEVK